MSAVSYFDFAALCVSASLRETFLLQPDLDDPRLITNALKVVADKISLLEKSYQE